MPLNRKPLPLEPDPESAQAARRWVADVLESLGRQDLVDSAELGVSELVTNAILHADPPISVRVRGTKDHPRVEVRDHSQHPPEANPNMTDEDSLLSTIGRGLGIVALYSSAWGSEVGPDGKTVWFEPSSGIESATVKEQQVFDFAQFVERRVASTPPPSEMLTIRFLDMPVQIFAAYRNRYNELRRELQLLAISHGNDYPVAKEISDLFVQVEQERRVAHGPEKLQQAIEEGLDRVDLDYEVPVTAPETMTQLLTMLEEADRFCRDQRLLALAASPQQVELQRWYLGEFARQAAGEEPQPWTGGFELRAVTLAE